MADDGGLPGVCQYRDWLDRDWLDPDWLGAWCQPVVAASPLIVLWRKILSRL